GEALGELRPLEAEVIRKRFGFEGSAENERTLAEVGAEHGLSRERIRQIQEQALGKLRKSLERIERTPRPTPSAASPLSRRPPEILQMISGIAGCRLPVAGCRFL